MSMETPMSELLHVLTYRSPKKNAANENPQNGTEEQTLYLPTMDDISNLVG